MSKIQKNNFKYDSPAQIELKYFSRKSRQLNEINMLSYNISIEFNKERNMRKPEQHGVANEKTTGHIKITVKSFTHRLDYMENKVAKYGDKTEELDHLAKDNGFFNQ